MEAAGDAPTGRNTKPLWRNATVKFLGKFPRASCVPALCHVPCDGGAGEKLPPPQQPLSVFLALTDSQAERFAFGLAYPFAILKRNALAVDVFEFFWRHGLSL
jgi:hypothetical protein